MTAFVHQSPSISPQPFVPAPSPTRAPEYLVTRLPPTPPRPRPATPPSSRAKEPGAAGQGTIYREDMDHFDRTGSSVIVKKPKRKAEKNFSKLRENVKKPFQDVEPVSKTNKKEARHAKENNMKRSMPRGQGAVGGEGILALERLLDIAGPEWSEEEEVDR